jgi:hypothetical protein
VNADHKSSSQRAWNGALTLLEATGGNRIAGQMRTQHAGQLFGVAALVDDDVANGQRLTPGAGVGAALPDGRGEWFPLVCDERHAGTPR